MISVFASEADHPMVREFFELFKTPWQFHEPGARAQVLLCAEDSVPVGAAALTIAFARQSTVSGAMADAAAEPPPLHWFRHADLEFPVHGPCRTDSSGNVVLQHGKGNGDSCVRIGFDLFWEVRHLLTVGQPSACAAVPTLEQLIALLRNLILSHGLPLVEIPPRPVGHEFIVCLTHDVDHVGIRNHKADHTLAGFCYRATVGSLWDAARGRKTVSQLAENWLAVLKLPLVHLGLAADFWHQFDRYVTLENGRASTFFVVPKKGETGLDAQGRRPAKRAVSYNVQDLREDLRSLARCGKEIGVHGIDAWRDAAAGRVEKKIIADLTGTPELGIRMHWLYFAAQSPVELENADFSYDSTVGYNDTVGYRAGTTQVFKPPVVRQMLELPMHLMDTALFYPSYLNLSPAQAERVVSPLIENGVRYGGALTVNWHDRSLAPERLWGGFYARLLEQLQARNPWFATAAQSVAWFRRRRLTTFEMSPTEPNRVGIYLPASSDDLPALRVRIFQPGKSGAVFSEQTLQAGWQTVLAN
jgi:hypothetical protein